MRILIVLSYFYTPVLPVGGAERQALKLAKGLQARGAQVTVVTGRWDPHQPRRDAVEGVPVARHFTGGKLTQVRGLRKFGHYCYLLSLFWYLLWRRAEYDVIHCHSAMFEAAIVARVGAWLRKKTLVRSMASGAWGDVKRLREGYGGSIRGAGWMLRQIPRADRIVALNQQVAAEWLAVGVSAAQIVYLPNGVETDRITPKMSYAAAAELRLTFVGRLHAQKGVDVLLRAFRQVIAARPALTWRLNLVGDGELRASLEALARELGLEAQVAFLGQVDDPFPVLQQSDLFILPSRSEGMSNALLEAMAHGLPCIVSDIPGNNEMIAADVNGVLVALDDPAALAAAILRLADDPALRARLGQAALRTVAAHYSLESVTDRYLKLYQEMVNGGV